MEMIELNRLQVLADRGNQLQAYCRCGHFAAVNLEVAIARFGPEFNTVDGREQLLASLRCSACGNRPIDLILLPPKQWGGAS